MNKNYTILHLHTMKSNATTVLDSVTSYTEYIDKAVECNMDSIAFTEHSNVLGWVSKKKYCDEKGIKYIHGVETYLTFSKEDKSSYHLLLLAKNYDGVIEINKLQNHLNAYNRSDEGNFYKYPRITFEQLKNTSDNIIITTACGLGVLNNATKSEKDLFIDFLKKNKHRVYLEIQHHNVEKQIRYNKYLYGLSQETGIPLVVGTDTHSLSHKHAEARLIMQKSKNIHFDDEEEWDLVFKTYDELIKAYKVQGSLSMNIVKQAIRNTNKISNQIEEFEFDLTKKYPKVYDDPQEQLNKRIQEGLEKRGHDITDKRVERIKHEISVFKSQDAIDFLLLEDWVKKRARDSGVNYGCARGSISGSYLAYLLEITKVPTLKYDLIFERFMNPERMSEPDIDSDYYFEDIPIMKDILYSNERFNCADIITYNTIQTKGAIRDVGRAFEMPLSEVDEISSQVENKEDELREKYPKLFKYVDILKGTIVSIGAHPAGVVVTDTDIYDKLGTLTTSTNDYPIVQIDMKEVEFLKYIKLDLLKLNTMGVINKTCELANIDVIDPNDINLEDWNVYKDIRENGSTGIFQWESDSAYRYYKKLFSDDTITKIDEQVDTLSYLELMSVGNGAIRPAGNSYRERLAEGHFHDNGSQVLDKLLEPTLGNLVYQEQILEFLNKFCGFSLGEADMVRRGFAKKTGTDKYIPKIKSGFIKTMVDDYGYSQEKAHKDVEYFLEVISNSSLYLFSLNHSLSYSIIGYETAWLRYHYPLEFITASLEVFDGNEEKTASLVEFATAKNITINPITFGKSKGNYFMDKDNNSVYKGIGSIKHLNADVGDELFQLSQSTQTNSFIKLLAEINEQTSLRTNQQDVLIKLDYFREYGNAKKLKVLADLFNRWYDKCQLHKERNDDNIHTFIKYGLSLNEIKSMSDETNKLYRNIDFIELLSKLEDKFEVEDYTIGEKCGFQEEYLGYINLTDDELEPDVLLCTKIDKTYTPRCEFYSIANGVSFSAKISKKIFYNNEFEVGSIIKAHNTKQKYGWKYIDGDFERDYDKLEWYVDGYTIIDDIKEVK